MRPGLRSARLACALAIACALPGCVRAGTIDPKLAAQVERTRHLGARPIPVIVELERRPDAETLRRAVAALPEAERPGALAARLRQSYVAAARPVRAAIERIGGTEVEDLWLTHAVAAVVAPKTVAALAATPGVARVYPDVALKAPAIRVPTAAEAMRARRNAQVNRHRSDLAVAPASPDRFDAAGWRGVLPAHLNALGVAEWWQRGVAGAGVVVAVVDSGVDGRDPVLRAGFRGGANDWLDPYAQQPAPHDVASHGSHVARLIAGRSAEDGQAPAGVAPHARWIAARIYDDGGVGKLSAIHRIHQWLLDPDGRPETADAPRIVNNSWALPQTVGRCEREFERDFALLRAAAIHVLFAAGNEGPGDGTSVSPSNNDAVLAVGALGADGRVAPASSRGPSACSGRPYPPLLAPGTALEIQDAAARIVGAADPVSGTSFAAALASGMLALVASGDAAAGFEERERRLAHALARGSAAHPAPIELAWAPVRQADGSISVDARSLRSVLPWNAQVEDVGLAPNGTAHEVVLEGGRVRTAASSTPLQRFTLLARAGDGRRWRIAVTPATAEEQPDVPKARRMTMAVRRGGSGLLTRAQLAGREVQSLEVQVSQSSRGAHVAVEGDGSVRYTARGGFRGVDTFFCEVTRAGEPPQRVAVSVYVN